MSDFLRGYRPSANVQSQSLDALRRNWLNEAAYAPDDYRSSWSLSPLSPETRGAVLDHYAGEQPQHLTTDWFNQGAPAQLPSLKGDGAPGQVTPLSFMQSNDLAVLGGQVGDLLQGRSVPSNTSNALSLLGAGNASPLFQLGGSRGWPR